MKKVNLGIALSLLSGVAAANTASTSTQLNNEQEYSLSRILVKPDTQMNDFFVAQQSGKVVAQSGKGGNGASSNGGNGGAGGNAGSGNGGNAGGNAGSGTKK